VPDMAAAMEAVLRRSADDMERASPLVGYDVPALVTAYRGWPPYYQGHLEAARDQVHRGLELARDRGALEVTGWALWLVSCLCCDLGDAARAVVAARESLDIAERIDSAVSLGMALHTLGRSLTLAGDAVAAVTALEQSLPYLERTILFIESEAWSDLALAHLSLGALGEAGAAARQALDRASRCNAFRGEVLALHALAAVRLAQSSDAASLAAVQQLLDSAEAKADEIGYRLILPRLCERRAELARQRGDTAEVEGRLHEVRRLYQEMGAPLQLKRLDRADLSPRDWPLDL